MAERLTMTVQLDGWRELAQRARADELIAPPWRDALEEVGQLLEQGAIAGAPIGTTGQLVMRMFHRVQRRPMPGYVVVGTKARRQRYAYPRFVNYSSTASRVRPLTRAGVPRRARPNPNLRWLERAIARVWPRVNQVLERAARRIEARWAGA